MGFFVNKQSNWIWSKEDPNQNIIAGDITRLFRAEGVDQPGVLGRNAPSEKSLLFAREAIQNSWDAAREIRSSELSKSFEPFLLRIHFRQFLGNAKREFAEALSLFELSARANQIGTANSNGRSELGLFEDDCLRRIDDLTDPLRVMYFIENGSLGMPGNWDKAESRMMFALNRVGYNKKMNGAGGSYGYGKAGLIQASRIRVVVAYSCFQEQASEPGITRRLLGAAYWGQHSHDGENFTGWIRLGVPTGGSAKPFENEHADEIARKLGMTKRSADVSSELGTTFVIIDPDFSGHDLRNAIERNWWPSLISEDGLRVEIEFEDGNRNDPCPPDDDPDLGPFVKAFRLATQIKEETHQLFRNRKLKAFKPQASAQTFHLGRIGLIADPEDWTFPQSDRVSIGEEEGLVRHQSMIALVRGPRMVVQYWVPLTGSAPYVRGVFIAGDEVDDLLRQTEPKAHDKWDTKLDAPGINPISTKIAKAVLDRIRSEVQEFRDTFRELPPPPGPVNLPELERLMGLLSGVKPPPPPKEKRPFVLTFEEQPRVNSQPDGKVFLYSKAAFSLSNHVSENSRQVELTIEVNFMEDSRTGSTVELEILKPDSFVSIESKKGKYCFKGELNKDSEPAIFQIKTVPYRGDWTTKLSISGRLAD